MGLTVQISCLHHRQVARPDCKSLSYFDLVYKWEGTQGSWLHVSAHGFKRQPHASDTDKIPTSERVKHSRAGV